MRTRPLQTFRASLPGQAPIGSVLEAAMAGNVAEVQARTNPKIPIVILETRT
jgi:hypothetical protein